VYVLRENGPDAGGAAVAGDAIVLLRKGTPAPSSRVYSLAVAPEHRGKKFGRALLCHCLAELRKEGALDVTLEVGVENAPAIALYESLGFSKARRIADYYGPSRDGWRMKLKFV
jgi:ribosomal protein S18 acetylase RimI-like enzyme